MNNTSKRNRSEYNHTYYIKNKEAILKRAKYRHNNKQLKCRICFKWISANDIYHNTTKRHLENMNKHKSTVTEQDLRNVLKRMREIFLYDMRL